MTTTLLLTLMVMAMATLVAAEVELIDVVAMMMMLPSRASHEP
jgi:hypothetical protein